MQSPATLHNPTNPTLNSSAELSATQARAVVLLAHGYSITHAAADIGVHRSTIYAWLKTAAAFQPALKEARQEYAENLRDDLRDLSSAALDTLRNLLASPETPACVRLNAALAVLERPIFQDAD